MRLMLGIKGKPYLLVDVENNYNPTIFNFHVINGAWNGTFTEGNITVWHPHEPWSDLNEIEILTDDQARLRSDYQTVFNNFHNREYISPRRDVPLFSDMDDDIPF